MNIVNVYNSHNLAILIKERANAKNVPLKQMLIECKLGSNTMSALYHGKSIAFDSLARIADFLDCSVDYLLGRTDKPDIESDKIKIAAANDGNSEIKILSDKLLILDLEDRATVNGLIDTLLSKEKYNKKPDQNVG